MSKKKTQIEEAREQKEMNTQEKAQEETKSTQNLADQPEDISVPGEIKDKGNNWMEELKQQINDGIDSISGKKKTAASEEGAPDQAEAAETALNKDLLQKTDSFSSWLRYNTKIEKGAHVAVRCFPRPRSHLS